MSDSNVKLFTCSGTSSFGDVIMVNDTAAKLVSYAAKIKEDGHLPNEVTFGMSHVYC